MGLGDKIGDAVDDIVDGIVDAIETAITKMLAGGASSMIESSLSLFKSGLKIDDGSLVGDNLTTMPNDYNTDVWNIVHVICTSVVAPIAGMILVIILLYELLTMVMEGNNFREFDTGIFFKWIIKALCGIVLISHTTDIIIGLFAMGNDITTAALGKIMDKDNKCNTSHKLFHSLRFSTGIIVSVAFDKVYDSPYTNTTADEDNESFKYAASCFDEAVCTY